MLKKILIPLILFLGVLSYVHTSYFGSFFYKKEECKPIKEPKLEKPINVLPLISEKIS